MPPVHAYTLPPDKLAQAIEFAHARNALHFGGVLISAAVLVLLIAVRLVPRMRHFHPAWVVLAVTLITALFDLPAEMYGHATSLRFHISIQDWPSWFWDWTKAQAVSAVIAVTVTLPFYWLLRHSPRRWWLIAWLISVPLMLVSAYADPLILAPLFNHFQPLAARHPELIPPIEQLLDKAGVQIPSGHLYEMSASEKTNSLNAYVDGFGPSRRLVLYDTIIRKEQGPPLLTTIGHELGHYVMRHIAKGLAVGSLALLISLWALSRIMPWIIARWGGRFEIHSISDWSSIPLFTLVVLIFGFFSEPLANAYSRSQEHAADVYSLEGYQRRDPRPGPSRRPGLPDRR